MAGDEPGSFAYEDDKAVGMMDIAPVNPGHVLIVPRVHAASLAELDQETGAHLFRVAMNLADALRRSGLRCEGVNVWLADGEAAGQDVPHVHLHVVPRWQGDGFRLDAEFGHPPREELDELAARVRAAL